jgi:hypothetical protein
MNLSFIAEIWDLLNYYVDSNDRSAAATTLVDFLVDNNYDADEIKAAFAGERDIIRALEAYDDQEYDDDDYEDEDDEEDRDW